MSPAGRPPATVSVQRVLAIVSWIASAGSPSIDEVCARFGISKRQLLDDLAMAEMVGAESEEYSDMPFEVAVEGDRVSVFLHAFQRPLRMTPAQALAVLGAAAGLRDLPGADPEGPLARAVDKVAAVLDIDLDEALEIDLGGADPDLLQQLNEAVEGRRRISLDYQAGGSGERRTRAIEPWQVVSAGGTWYLHGADVASGGPRLYRVDRIRGVAVLDEAFTPPSPLPPAEPWRDTEGAPRAVIDLVAEARWVVDAYPVDSVEARDDGFRVTLPVAGRSWLERLLLRLGPAARLVEVDPRIGDVGLVADAARRVLARYGGGT